MCFQLIPLAVIAVVEGVEAGTAAAIGGEALADALLAGLEAAGAGFSEGLLGEVADAGLDCLLGPVGGTVAGFALGVSSGASAVAGVSGSIATGSLPGLDELGSSAGAPSGLTFVSSAPLDSGANVPDDAQTLSSLQGADFDQAAVEQFHSLLNGLGGSDNSGMQLASFNPSGGNGVVQIGNAQVGSNDLPAGYTVDDGSVASSLDSTGFQNVADKSGAAPAQPSQVPDLVGQIHDLPEGSHVSQFGDYSYVVTYPPEWEDGNQVVRVLVIGHVDSQAAQYAASLGLPATGETVVLPLPSSIPAPDFTVPPVKATPAPTDYVGLSQPPSSANLPSSQQQVPFSVFAQRNIPAWLGPQPPAPLPNVGIPIANWPVPLANFPSPKVKPSVPTAPVPPPSGSVATRVGRTALGDFAAMIPILRHLVDGDESPAEKGLGVAKDTLGLPLGGLPGEDIAGVYERYEELRQVLSPADAAKLTIAEFWPGFQLVQHGEDFVQSVKSGQVERATHEGIKTGKAAVATAAMAAQGVIAFRGFKGMVTGAGSPKLNPPKGSAPPRLDLVHTFHGEINAGGEATGFHKAGSTPFARVDEVVQSPNGKGVYQAKVSVYDQATRQWVPKAEPSTMFPDHWTAAQTVKEIQGAFDSRDTWRAQQGGSYRWFGQSPSGVPMGGYYDPTTGNVRGFPIRK